MSKHSSCDYCGSTTQTLHAETNIGLLACDQCLLEHSDDSYPDWADARFAAACKHKRGIDLLEMDRLMANAAGLIVQEQIDRVRDAVSRADWLYREGETLAAMEAAQSAWEMANGLYNSIAVRKDVQVGRKVRAGGAKGGDESRESRAGGKKRAAIVEALKRYNDPLTPPQRQKIARDAGATERHVRDVIKSLAPDKNSEM